MGGWVGGGTLLTSALGIQGSSAIQAGGGEAERTLLSSPSPPPPPPLISLWPLPGDYGRDAGALMGGGWKGGLPWRSQPPPLGLKVSLVPSNR